MSIDRLKAFYFWTTTLSHVDRVPTACVILTFRLQSDFVDEALRLARGRSEYDPAPRNGAEYRFHENQDTGEEQRCEYQVSSGLGTGMVPPMGVGSVDESSQQKNGHTDAAASVSDLDEYRPYAWIYPDGVVRQDSESGDQDGQDDRR